MKFLSVLQFAFLAFYLSACGQSGNQVVKNVSVATHVKDNDVYVDVNAIFDLGNTALPTITLPIFDPRNPGTNYGSISMAATLDGRNQIGVSVNFTKATKLPGGSAHLPNGSNLPIGGLQGIQVVEILIPNTTGRIYVALDRGVAMAGFAFSIKEMDQIGANIPGVNLFPRFSFNRVNGIAGVYTGAQSGQTGLALFVDLSALLPQDAYPLAMNQVMPATKKKNNLEYSLFKFSSGKSKKRLSLHR